jgi:glycine cleavage system H protein
MTAMAFDYPEDLRYADTHEYVRVEGDVATIGITAFAIDQLGDIVFLELPDVGTLISQGDSFGTIESVKAVEDLKAPVTGEVLDRNAAMIDAPEKLGDDPYVGGWMLRVKLATGSDAETLMTPDVYRSKVEGV